MSKAERARYTLEFKLEAVRPGKAGQSTAAVAATLGVPMLATWEIITTYAVQATVHTPLFRASSAWRLPRTCAAR